MSITLFPNESARVVAQFDRWVARAKEGILIKDKIIDLAVSTLDLSILVPEAVSSVLTKINALGNYYEKNRHVLQTMQKVCRTLRRREPACKATMELLAAKIEKLRHKAPLSIAEERKQDRKTLKDLNNHCIGGIGEDARAILDRHKGSLALFLQANAEVFLWPQLLHYGTREHVEEVVRSRGKRAILNWKDHLGRTPFHFAAKHNRGDLMDLLLSEDLFPESRALQRDQEGKCPLEIAVVNDYSEVATALLATLFFDVQGDPARAAAIYQGVKLFSNMISVAKDRLVLWKVIDQSKQVVDLLAEESQRRDLKDIIEILDDELRNADLEDYIDILSKSLESEGNVLGCSENDVYDALCSIKDLYEVAGPDFTLSPSLLFDLTDFWSNFQDGKDPEFKQRIDDIGQIVTETAQVRDDQERLNKIASQTTLGPNALAEIDEIFKKYQGRLFTLLKVNSRTFLWDPLLQYGSMELLKQLFVEMGKSTRCLKMLTPKGESALAVAARLGYTEMKEFLFQKDPCPGDRLVLKTPNGESLLPNPGGLSEGVLRMRLAPAERVNKSEPLISGLEVIRRRLFSNDREMVRKLRPLMPGKATKLSHQLKELRQATREGD